MTKNAWLPALAALALSWNPATAGAENWPAWRGPSANGVSSEKNLPTTWSVTENITWKLPMPSLSGSTPIVWGDRIFLTTAIPYGELLPPKPDTAPGAHDNAPVSHRQELAVLAVGRARGEILWQVTVGKDLPHEGSHVTASFASHSPVTDGERLFAFFGSRGLYGLDTGGKILWRKDFGRMQTKHGHGEGSSPVLHGDTLVVNWDHEGGSFVTALDKRTGEERWRTERREDTSWASPIVVEHEGKPQVVVSGTNRVRGYDLATGSVIWECGGLSDNVVASPVAAGGMVFAASSYETQAMLAIRLDGARGDITGTGKVAWTRQRRTPYVPSPLLYGDSLYFLRHYQGILYRVEARTGEEQGPPLRLESIGDVYGSPVGAAGRVYITDLAGATEVVSHGREGKVLARNRLDDSFSASAALAGREIFLRGLRHLYCIAAE
jgi:outer membrane protein assembly factor BamB